uniref:BHLH domain-containing protein n=1 Tax=Grammatophora oceanica TaxID=210454 RepID=A0A7S1Y931_9STRA
MDAFIHQPAPPLTMDPYKQASAVALAPHEQRALPDSNSDAVSAPHVNHPLQPQPVAPLKRPLDDESSFHEGGPDDDDDDEFETGGKSGKSSSSGSRQPEPKRLKSRKERNQREKERSNRIAEQIDEIRRLLEHGGLSMSRGTKSAVLREAANYIRQLKQQMQLTNQYLYQSQACLQQQKLTGAPFGTTPIPVAPTSMQPTVILPTPPMVEMTQSSPQVIEIQQHPATAVSDAETEPMPTTVPAPASQTPHPGPALDYYRLVFNVSSMPMAIASLGGDFIACNEQFCKFAKRTEEEIRSITVFNLTRKQDLKQAFDTMSKIVSNAAMLAGIESFGNPTQEECYLRTAIDDSDNLNLLVSLVKDEDNAAKCFSVTLVEVAPAVPTLSF